MELVKPDIGLIFWMLVSFGILLFLLRLFAWRPILSALREREDTIADSLSQAEKARQEASKQMAENEKIMEEARKQKEKLLDEARELKENMIVEAREDAQKMARKEKEHARAVIAAERDAAIKDLKTTVAELSVEIAEQILKSELSDPKKQQDIIDSYIKKMDMN